MNILRLFGTREAMRGWFDRVRVRADARISIVGQTIEIGDLRIMAAVASDRTQLFQVLTSYELSMVEYDPSFAGVLELDGVEALTANRLRERDARSPRT